MKLSFILLIIVFTIICELNIVETDQAGDQEKIVDYCKPKNHDFIKSREIYEEQGFVLLQASTPEEAKYLIEKITNTEKRFLYSEFGLNNHRVDQAKSDPAKVKFISKLAPT